MQIFTLHLTTRLTIPLTREVLVGQEIVMESLKPETANSRSQSSFKPGTKCLTEAPNQSGRHRGYSNKVKYLPADYLRLLCLITVRKRDHHQTGSRSGRRPWRWAVQSVIWQNVSVDQQQKFMSRGSQEREQLDYNELCSPEIIKIC